MIVVKRREHENYSSRPAEAIGSQASKIIAGESRYHELYARMLTARLMAEARYYELYGTHVDCKRCPKRSLKA